MILPLFSVDSFSRDGLAAITDRYASLARLNGALATHRLGQRLPIPVAFCADPISNAADVRDVIGIVCGVPFELRAMFARKVSEDRYEAVGVPFASDLNECGVCRCGCGFKVNS